MGSWGIEIFEEDYALDWLADLCEHDDPKEFFEECLDIDDCDLELIECSGVLGTCAMIDGATADKDLNFFERGYFLTSLLVVIETKSFEPVIFLSLLEFGMA